MLGTVGASWLLVLSLLAVAVVAVGIGFVASVFLRKPWGAGGALADALIGPFAATAAGYIIYYVEAAPGIWEPQNVLVLLIASAAVILRHLVRRRSHEAS